MDYSQLSDFEINQRVSNAIPGRFIFYPDYVWDSEWEKTFDPCNKAADAWPIIFENKVMLSPHCADDEWKAQIYLGRDDIFDNYASAWHKKPLRAAMIVFLMKQGHPNS